MSKFKLLEQTDDWYISRTADLSDKGLSLLQQGKTIVGRHGSVLTILSSEENTQSLNAGEDVAPVKVYKATLSHAGRLSFTHPVELEVKPIAPGKVELGLAVAKGKPHRFISPQRYFTSAWSVLDELYDQLGKSKKSRAA
ncbi:MAG: hypothetical protein M1374_00510 [Firmicutes bacterium]|jgi:hypothetical protein|nr:hypothetical protein [Bacillota bacterium]